MVTRQSLSRRAWAPSSSHPDLSLLHLTAAPPHQAWLGLTDFLESSVPCTFRDPPSVTVRALAVSAPDQNVHLEPVLLPRATWGEGEEMGRGDSKVASYSHNSAPRFAQNRDVTGGQEVVVSPTAAEVCGQTSSTAAR